MTSLSPPPRFNTENPESAVKEPPFFGRDTEISELESAFLNAVDGRGTLTIVEGASGCGKSRVLREFGRRMQERRAHVFMGEAVNAQTENPCQALSGIVSGLVRLLRSDQRFREEFCGRFTWERDPLCSVFPELSEFLSPSGSQHELRYSIELRNEATSRAVTLMLNALGAQRNPSVLIFDDMQWADPFTLKVLANWGSLNAGLTSGGKTLIVIAYRPEDLAPKHILRRLVAAPRVTIGPFERGAIGPFLESIAGPLSGDTVALIHRLSGGNAFLSSCVLRGMIDSQMLVQHSGVLSPGEHTRSSAIISSGTEFIRRRLEVLDETERELIQWAAVYGGDVDLALFAHALKRAPSEMASLLAGLSRRHIFTDGDAPQTFRFAHSKLREAALELVSDDAKKEVHRSLAHSMVALGRQSCYELAHHFDQAGETALALPYALQSIEDARSRTSLSALEHYLRIAIKGSGHENKQIRFDLLMELHLVLMLRGGYLEATTYLDQAMELAESKEDLATILLRRCEQGIKEGQFDKALTFGEQAVKLRGGRIWPKKLSGGMVAKLLADIAIYTLKSVYRRPHRRPKEEGREIFALAHSWHVLGVAYWWGRSSLHVLYPVADLMDKLEDFEPSDELVINYAGYGIILSLTPFRRFSDSYFERGLAWSRQRRDLRLEGHCLCWFGVALLAQGRFKECLNVSVASLRVLEQSGDLLLIRMAEASIGHALFRIGNLKDAVAQFQRIFESSIETGDIACATDALTAWARVTVGAVPPEHFEAVRERITPENLLSRAILSMGLGLHQLSLNDIEGAIKLFESGISVVTENFVLNDYCAPLFFWHVTALRMRIEQSPPSGDRRKLLAEALRHAKRAKLLARFFTNNAPHALRELGLLYAIKGDESRSKASFRRSLAQAQRRGMRYEQAVTKFEISRVAEWFGWPEASTLDGSREALTALGANSAFHSLLVNKVEVTGGEDRTLS